MSAPHDLVRSMDPSDLKISSNSQYSPRQREKRAAKKSPTRKSSAPGKHEAVISDPIPSTEDLIGRLNALNRMVEQHGLIFNLLASVDNEFESVILYERESNSQLLAMDIQTFLRLPIVQKSNIDDSNELIGHLFSDYL